MTEKEFLQKYDNGISFSAPELAEITKQYSIDYIVNHGEHGLSISYMIVHVTDRYFKISHTPGFQNEIDGFRGSVVKECEKTITGSRVEWRDI